MPRPEKVQAVADIKERIEDANAVFLAEYAGLTVKEQQELRRSLRESGAEFKVLKMTLTRRAAGELDLESLDELLVGPTGLTFADGDPVSAAKALDEFAKTHEVFTIKGGLLGRDFLAPERVRELAKIEPRDVLLAKLAGAFQAPLANLAGLLAALPRGLATAMSQLIEKRAEAEAVEVAEEEAAGELEVAAVEAVAETFEADAPTGSEPALEVAVVEEVDSDAAKSDAASEADDGADEAETPDADEKAAAPVTADAPAEPAEEKAPDAESAAEPPEAAKTDEETKHEDDDETAETAEEE